MTHLALPSVRARVAWTLLAALPAPLLGQDPLEVAQLLPEEPLGIARIASLEGALELVRSLAPEGAHVPTMAELLEEEELPVDLALVATDRPLYFAFDVGDLQPLSLWILPVEDPEAFLAAAGPEVTAVAGERYVAVGLHPGPGAGAERVPSRALERLGDAPFALHVDLERLIGALRPLVDMGLDLAQAQRGLATEPTDAAPFDPAVMVQAGVGLVREGLDSAGSLRLALEPFGGAIELRADFEAREASWLADFAAALAPAPGAPVGSPDPEPWLSLVDTSAAFYGVGHQDMEAWLEASAPLFEALFALYPEAMRADFRRLLAASERIAPLVGSPVAVSVDYRKPIGAVYVLPSPDPAALLGRIEGLLAEWDEPVMGLRLSEPARAEVADRQVLQYEVRPDPEAMEALLDSLAGLDLDRDQDALRDQLDVLGEQWRLSFALLEGALLVVGGDQARLAETLARKPRAGSVAPALRDALGRLGATGGAYHVDYGRMLAGVSEWYDKGFPLPLPERLPLTLWGSIEGRTFSGGVSIAAADVRALVHALEEWEEELADDARFPPLEPPEPSQGE